MKKIVLLGILLFGAACITKEATAPIEEKKVITETWQEEWNKTISKAKNEERVVIYTLSGPAYRDSLAKGFKKSHGLNIEWIVGRNPELVPKIKAERRAGLFLGDVFMATSLSLMEVKDLGFLAPLETELILPEVKDPGFWLDAKLPWVDEERFIIAPSQIPYILFIKREKTPEVSSYRDLLNPKWKGKIASVDPRTTGSPRSWVVLSEKMGWDYMREFASQVVFAPDTRLATEWTVRGKTDITFTPSNSLMEFLLLGAPLEIINLDEEMYVSGGGSVLSLINQRPHPYASKVFVNWYLSREGQQIVADFYGNMRKDLDTSQIHPSRKRMEGVKYFSFEDEGWIRETQKKEKSLMEFLNEILKF